MNNKIELNKLIRQTYKYRKWRKAVLLRDNFACQICGIKEVEKFEVDHYPRRLLTLLSEYRIASLRQAEKCEELWGIDNGRVLCPQCHKNTPTYGLKEEGKIFEVSWGEKETEDGDLEESYSAEIRQRQFFTEEEAEDFASMLKNDRKDFLIGRVKIINLQDNKEISTINSLDPKTKQTDELRWIRRFREMFSLRLLDLKLQDERSPYSSEIITLGEVLESFMKTVYEEGRESVINVNKIHEEDFPKSPRFKLKLDPIISPAVRSRTPNLVAQYILNQNLEIGGEGVLISRDKYLEILASNGKRPTPSMITNGIAIQLRPLQKRGLYFNVMKGVINKDLALKISQAEEMDIKEGSMAYYIERVAPPKTG